MFGLFVSSAQSDVFSGNECDASCVLGGGVAGGLRGSSEGVFVYPT